MKAIPTLGVLALAIAPAAWAQEYARGRVEPVYVGARECGACHWGEEAGNQYERWLASPHARAWAALASPEAWEIARLSGVPVDPQESLVCLGCHATAWDTEDWERDDTFVLTDGVQCERCHGPGSEYHYAEVMSDPEAARARGLRTPTDDDCRVCHSEKGSHTAVLGPSGFDLETWKARLAHPRPPDGLTYRDPSERMRVGFADEVDSPRWLGVAACAECHAGADMGYQLSRWLSGPHALAWSSLATPRGREIAAEMGVSGDPRESERCLACHATTTRLEAGTQAEGFDLRDGVQCESCHGPGGGYAAEPSPDGHHPAPPTAPDEATCRGCHDGAHGAPFELGPALEAIAHPKHPPGREAEERYKTPLNLAFSPDGRELYVACEAAGSLIVVDTQRRERVAEIPTGGQATDVTVDPVGERAYVSNRLDDNVAVVDLATRSVVERIAVGDEPHGLLFDPAGERLYVLATHEDSIDVVSPQAGERVLRLAAGRRPWSLALSPDGRTFAVTNTLAELAGLRENTHSELTLVDAERGRVVDRIRLPDTNLVQGVAWHPSGEFLLATLNRTKSLVPMTRLLQGWTITNGFALVWTDGRVDQLLLDRNDVCFPDAADVACTPDGRLALFTSSGSDRVAVVDVARLLELLRGSSDEEREEVLPNHTGAPCEFTVADVPTGRSPRGVAIDPQGRFAYTADSLDDTLTVIDLASLEAVATIDLGGPTEITKVRWGEQLFHSADIAFRRQFSCHSCHPDGNVDGITYDIEPDGIGLDPVDNRTLRGILDTAPFKWSGLNPNLQRQCGPRLAVFFTRVDPFTPEELDALTTYICTIPRPPNRFRPLGADLTPAQRRGKRLFERSHRNDGSPIPPRGRCVNCHPPPLFTDRRKHDLGFLFPYDRSSSFDTPHLNNVYETAPYLHNGAARTLEEIWTRYNPDDVHGVTNDMTKDQLNDLIEYLKTL